MFFRSAVSGPLDLSKCFKRHPCPHLFIPTPIRLLWEAFDHAAIIAPRLFTHIFNHYLQTRAKYSFKQLSELGRRVENETTQALKP